ncbi:MAG: hypothetical protein HKN10_19940 [Myxococcales bacterium]|nr:hypothetical protein [Myxococcales bacterium]
MKSSKTSATTLTPSIVHARHRQELTRLVQRGAMLNPSSDWEIAELRGRVKAGLWAARIALVLSVPFAITAWANAAEQAWLTFMLLPVVAAFFAGSFFGTAIARPHEVSDELLAGRRGVLVALAAYLIYALEVAVMSAASAEVALNTLMWSLLGSGWLVLPIAFSAGVLAFRVREGATRHSQPAEA